MNTSTNVMETADHAMQSAQEAIHTAARDGSRVRAKLEHSLDAARSSLRDGTKHIQATVRNTAEGADNFVHSSPWSAIGLAAAAGAAIGVLLGTRMRR
jgi:ElaB/YqjD/DUF883 family membrane-anchored ribosome-binding protein